MPYKRRLWIPDRFYHVVSRGNRRDPLFWEDADFLAFFHILKQVYEKYPFEIAAYCLMTNHFHLLMRSPEVPLSKVMSLINKRYANYYNNRYGLTGHVFEKRFRGDRVDDRRGILAVSWYIHLNPVEARMVNHPSGYSWSSYYLFKDSGFEQPDFMNTDYILDFYQGTAEEKRGEYCAELDRRRDDPKYVGKPCSTGLFHDGSS
ncbi:transposase [Bacillus dakarensis]|uniref:transposase n=1 Tax=Robertmurraya dakarensis TaxID=1926278 RepID=UPI00098187C6|nr:transposase [Bacillus dakarensis]